MFYLHGYGRMRGLWWCQAPSLVSLFRYLCEPNGHSVQANYINIHVQHQRSTLKFWQILTLIDRGRQLLLEQQGCFDRHSQWLRRSMLSRTSWPPQSMRVLIKTSLLLKNKLASLINKSNCYNINVPNESKSSELVLITRYCTKVN